jgi:hypothetical protein
VEFPEAAKIKHNKAKSDNESGIPKMFTGTLIADLIATVERVEHKSSDITIAGDSMVADSLVADSWFASVQESTDYDSKLLGVA